MIEIIKHGKELGKQNRIILTGCPECGCIFKFDVDEDTTHSRLFCKDYVYCPDCGTEIIVRDTGSMTSDDPDKIMCEII